jgi:hypothetical protein
MPRRLLVSGFLATGLLISTAAVVVAGPDAEMAIQDPSGNEPVVGGTITVCEFHLVALPGSDEHETGTWRIHSSDGGTVRSGAYETAAGQPDRIPDTGQWSLAEGSYLLEWDSEPIDDRSRSEKAFLVACGGAGGVAPSGGVAPTGEALPTTGLKQDRGAVEVTLPPTDAAPAIPAGGDPGSGPWVVLLALGLVGALALMATPRRVARMPAKQPGDHR